MAPGNKPLSDAQHARAWGLRQAGFKRRDAEALVRWWDSIPLERRLAMFELAGNDAEADLVRRQLEREER